MKKILMLAALPLIILFFSCTAHAETYANLDQFQDDLYSVEGFRLPSNDPLITFWINNPDKVLFLGRRSSGAAAQACFGTGLYLEENGNTKNIKNHDSEIYSLYSTGSSSYTPASYYWDGWNYSYGLYDGIVGEVIDWDTIYYNPQIPVPKLNIWYMYQVESYREDGIANFAANIDVPDSTEFYVELAWKYSFPQNIRVYSSDMKGTPAYDYELYKSSDLISIYSLQDQQAAINLHVTGSDLQTAWQDAYNDFIDGVTFYTNQSNAPANWLSTARLNYVNKMATQIPLYGNRLEVFARYWTLSEDNQVVVGKWYHWQSAKGSATEDIPENYVNYQELPGYAGTVEDIPSDDENTYTGTGETTGEQATTIINYAPNYPDYPTAVSYNHDNILLQMIQTSKQLPQFFGQFTNFLAITLAFIDPGVWAIIGFGFTCCIVIMIIKVL